MNEEKLSPPNGVEEHNLREKKEMEQDTGNYQCGCAGCHNPRDFTGSLNHLNAKSLRGSRVLPFFFCEWKKSIARFLY